MSTALRNIARRAALKIPPIHRLYNSAHRANRLLVELGTVVEERDSLDLQLYTLRSEYQRAIGKNDELCRSLEAADSRTRELEQAKQDLSTLRAEHDRAVGTNQELLHLLEATGIRIRGLELRESPVFAGAGTTLDVHHIELVYAKLSARLTLLAADVHTALRAQRRPGAENDSDLQAIRSLYLNILERALTGALSGDPAISPWSSGYDPEVRLIGRDWPATAQTMIGLARLRNIRVLAEQVFDQGVPGDFLEAGVWRGGACIYMRGLMAAHGIENRTVWVADSFQGLPPPNPDLYPSDAGDPHHTFKELRVSIEEVQANFERYALLDDQVRFLKGWFAETLPEAPLSQLALLRLDGDMYSSTSETLHALYHKVSPRGYVIIDDYILAGCRKAVDDFREQFGIAEPLQDIDGAAVFWRKAA